MSAAALATPTVPRVSRRGILVWSAVGFVIYSLFTNASRSQCFGGLAGTGGYIDAEGRPTDVPPTCVTMHLGPSWIVQAAVIAIVAGAIIRSRRRPDEDAARQTLQRATLAVVALCLGSMAIAQVWFLLLPLGPVDGGYSLPLPVPVGWVESWSGPMGEIR